LIFNLFIFCCKYILIQKTSFRTILAITGFKLLKQKGKQKYIYSIENMNKNGYRAAAKKEYKVDK